MPELPEVETIVRALRPLVTGLTIKELHLYHPRVYRYNSPGLLKSSVSGRRIDTITRLGKYILFRFVEGSRPAMVVHLRMTGQLLFTRQSPETNYVRAALEFTDSNWLLFRDVRTFGALFLEGDDAPPGFRNLGVEPLSKSFQTELLRKILECRSIPIKPLLLRQELIAGIGNIYASEILFHAGIHPARKSNTLESEKIERLYLAMQRVLHSAIDQMGTTLSDFRKPDGKPGNFANELLVYGKQGTPCRNCNTLIERIKQHGRSTFFCPVCQPAQLGG